ncbi:MAG: hypothetical protein BWX70_02487 [Verrucomicrobia bacterium ADurb.Bin070]|nr:MAG: hypothetical protein BWX70_02487 [Verrucomicrobia bacterium ADurb.Bin070]
MRARGGIGHTMAKINAGQEVTVAYLGGSITAMNGWRNKTTEWLRATYPRASFKEVHAAIGGTGSDLGVFRLGRDVLAQHPDLLFVEFATNDGGTPPEQIWCSMEGIVRQTWRQDPRTDIVFTYTITTAFTNDYCKGLCNRSASAMELLADHYAIPSINFGPRVAALINANKLVMDAKGVAAAETRLLFADDGVHPRDEGHDLYKASIIEGLTQMKAMPPADHVSKLAVPFVADHWEAAKMVPVTRAMLSGEWTALPPEDGKQKAFGARMGQIWSAEKPGSALRFRFKGRVAKLYDLLGPDGGQVVITVNGRRGDKPVPRFDSYCTYHRIATLGAVWGGGDPEQVQEVTVEIHPEQPDRKSVAFRLKDPETELKAPKFQGTRVWISQLMLIGDVVE